MATASPAWMADAACAGEPTETFFPHDSDHELAVAARVTCNRCPVRVDCLEYALEGRIDHGIFGGYDPAARNRIRRQRRRDPHREEPTTPLAGTG